MENSGWTKPWTERVLEWLAQNDTDYRNWRYHGTGATSSWIWHEYKTSKIKLKGMETSDRVTLGNELINWIPQLLIKPIRDELINSMISDDKVVFNPITNRLKFRNDYDAQDYSYYGREGSEDIYSESLKVLLGMISWSRTHVPSDIDSWSNLVDDLKYNLEDIEHLLIPEEEAKCKTLDDTYLGSMQKELGGIIAEIADVYPTYIKLVYVSRYPFLHEPGKLKGLFTINRKTTTFANRTFTSHHDVIGNMGGVDRLKFHSIGEYAILFIPNSMADLIEDEDEKADVLKMEEEFLTKLENFKIK